MLQLCTRLFRAFEVIMSGRTLIIGLVTAISITAGVAILGDRQPKKWLHVCGTAASYSEKNDRNDDGTLNGCRPICEGETEEELLPCLNKICAPCSPQLGTWGRCPYCAVLSGGKGCTEDCRDVKEK